MYQRLLCFLSVAMLIVGGASGCDDRVATDGDADVDADIDADIDGDIEPDGDVAEAGPARSSGFAQTSGGGRATTPQHRIQLRIGAPQPVGTGTTSNRRLRLGPGSLR